MGTVIALARSKGHSTVGVDIDPLAVLISRVWTTSADTTEAQLKAREVLVRARKIFFGAPAARCLPRRVGSTHEEICGVLVRWLCPKATNGSLHSYRPSEKPGSTGHFVLRPLTADHFKAVRSFSSHGSLT